MTMILEKTAGLLAFVRTVEAGSFAKASRVVGSSPSAISKSVARLERRLNVRLLQRSTRSLSLTVEGQAYYERVAPLLREIENAEDVVQVASTARGLLRVTVPLVFGRMLIAAWAKTFLIEHPDVKLELHVTDQGVDLIRENFDLAVRIGALEDTGLIGRTLGKTRHVLAASPEYLARRGTPHSIDDLRKHDCLRYLLGARPYPYSFSDGTSIIVNGPMDTADGQHLREAALGGAGIIYLPQFAIADDLAAGRLILLLPDIATPSTPIHVLHPFERQLPVRARLFVNFLVKNLCFRD